MEVIFLIGLPGSGKTTWRLNFVRQRPDFVVISTDDLLANWASESGETYDQTWKTSYSKAAEAAFSRYCNALGAQQNIIIDRTNLVSTDPNPNPNSAYASQVKLERQPLLRLVPPEYKRIALVFDEKPEVIEERRVLRQLDKNVPPDTITRMRGYYQPPTENEFDVILTPAEFPSRPASYLPSGSVSRLTSS